MIDLRGLPENALQAITSEELRRSTELFNVVKQLRLRLTNVTEDTLDRSFKQHVQNVFNQLESKLPSLKTHSSRQAEIVMARHGLCDASMQQIILLCEGISPALGGVISQVRGMHSAYLADLHSVEETFSGELADKEKYVEEARREVEAIDLECSQLLEASSLLDEEAARNTDLILSLRQELRETNAEVARLQLMIAPDQLQSPRQLSASTSFGSPDKQLQQQRILAAADPLPGMTTSVTRNVRGQVVVPPKSPARGLSSGLPSHSSGQLSASQMRQSQSSYSNDSSRYMDPTKSRRAAWGPSTGTSSALVASAGAGPETTARSTSTMHTKTMYGSSSAWLMGFRGELQQKMDGNLRAISLKECRSLLQQFYDSKEGTVSARVLAGATATADPTSSGGDKRRSASSVQLQDIETMEIHVYRCLEKKYGLRTLAVEHAAMFLAGLKTHSPSNIDVAVFYKIFCNEIEEGFVKVQQELEKSIKDLLILQVMNKHAHKDQEALNAVVDSKLAGVMSDHEYMDIVNYLYNEKDATQLRVILGLACQEAHDRKMGAEAVPRNHLEYKNTNITCESDMKKKLGYVPTTGRREASSTRGGGRGPGSRKVAQQQSPQQPQLPADYFDLPYATVVRLCLQFQLTNHEKYLTNFRASFLFHDSDNDGILSAEEFRNCFMELRGGLGQVLAEDLPDPSEEDLDMFHCLLELVDPNETDRITFSNAADRLNSIGKRAATPSKGKRAVN